MPTFSELTVTFTKDFKIGDQITILTVYQDVLYLTSPHLWVATRSTSGEVSTTTATSNPGEATAINFEAAFDLDNVTGYVTTVQNTNEVLIQSELDL